MGRAGDLDLDPVRRRRERSTGCSGRTIRPAAAARRRPRRARPGGWRGRAERTARRPAACPAPSPAAAAAGLTAASSRRPPASDHRGERRLLQPASPAVRRSRLGSRPARRSRSIGQRGRKRYMTRRIRHLHHPSIRRLAAAAAQQLDPPARAPDPRLVRAWAAATGSAAIRQRVTAALGRARSARRLAAAAPAPQQQGGDAGALGGELQPAARHHRQPPRPRRPPRRCPGAAQPLLHRPQDLVVARRRGPARSAPGSSPCAARPGP